MDSSLCGSEILLALQLTDSEKLTGKNLLLSVFLLQH